MVDANQISCDKLLFAAISLFNTKFIKKLAMKLFAICICIVISQLAYAQCNPAIPNSTTPITLNMVTLTSGDFWICENLLATDNNTASNIYMEENSSLNCYACTAEIWIKAGCTVNVYSNGTPTIHLMPGASVLDVGGMATLDTCSSVTFDYSNAPSGGCVPTNVNDILSHQTNLYPNPNNGTFNIELPVEMTGTYQAKIYSLKGELVERISITSSAQIDLKLEKGYYLIEIQTEQKELIRKSFIIQ